MVAPLFVRRSINRSWTCGTIDGAIGDKVPSRLAWQCVLNQSHSSRQPNTTRNVQRPSYYPGYHSVAQWHSFGISAKIWLSAWSTSGLRCFGCMGHKSQFWMEGCTLISSTCDHCQSRCTRCHQTSTIRFWGYPMPTLNVSENLIQLGTRATASNIEVLPYREYLEVFRELCKKYWYPVGLVKKVSRPKSPNARIENSHTNGVLL